MEMQEFYRGLSFDAHKYFGAHLKAAEHGPSLETSSTDPGNPASALPRPATFRVFAPAAAGVVLLLGSCAEPADTPPREIPLDRAYDGNVFEVRVPDVRPGDPYEYRTYRRDGSYQDHCDPFGFGMDLRPGHRSIVRDLGAYRFSDDAWMQSRSACLDRPLNIYELHAGSWRKPKDENGEEQPDLWYRYDELAEPLIAYLKEGGYTHVEFLPLTEYPADESWGYQPVGFFSPTSRFGTADQLMALIDRLHQAGIGAILDFVPVHFARDAWGLANFDGTALFEYPNQDVGVSEWGSCNFMHSRGEVRSLLQSAAQHWLGAFHFDGLRLDAISRIIYWQGDERRGVNGNAVDFIRTLNAGLHARNAGCLLAAEDSTNFPGVTHPASEGGLGFDYKWDMGWMHDTLSVFQMPPAERREKYHKLTFSMMYYGGERYLLPFSHDEVVHGKATILQKMNGAYEGKFAQGRALYLYMAAHPGKMLNFMGSEFGQLREWDEKREQDWLLLSYPVHDAFRRFTWELNKLYLEHPALWERDYGDDGFAWLDCHQEARVIYAFVRRGGGEHLACVLNLSDEEQDYAVPLDGSAMTGEASESDGRPADADLPTADGARPAETVASEPEPADTLLYTDWQRFAGATPDDENPCTVADGILRCRLAPNSGVLVLV